MIKTGQILNNTYEVREPIGSGSGGIIFKAYHLRMKKAVAIKLVKNEVKGKVDIRTEVDVLKNLKNDYLPTVIDFVEDGEDIYTVMEFIEGKNFKQLIESGKTFSEKSVRKYAKQLCRAVSYLHNHKPPIIHSDIKPSNIMLTPEDNICLIDFNISMISNNGVSEALGGSRGFAAPEQFKRIISVPSEIGGFQEQTRFIDNDETEIILDDDFFSNTKSSYTLKTKNTSLAFVDIKSDIYGIGASVYYMLTGRIPYNGKTDFRGIYASGRIKEVINKSMNPVAFRRYINANEMEKALGTYVSKRLIISGLLALSAVISTVVLYENGVFDKETETDNYVEESDVTSVVETVYEETYTETENYIETSANTETEPSSIITDDTETEVITEVPEEAVTMPDLLNLNIYEAQKICDDHNIKYVVRMSENPVVPNGIVIGQSVKAEDSIDADDKVVIIISKKKSTADTEKNTVTETETIITTSETKTVTKPVTKPVTQPVTKPKVTSAKSEKKEEQKKTTETLLIMDHALTVKAGSKKSFQIYTDNPDAISISVSNSEFLKVYKPDWDGYYATITVKGVELSYVTITISAKDNPSLKDTVTVDVIS